MVCPQILRITEGVVCRPRIFLVSIVALICRRCDEPYSVGGTITMKAMWRMLMCSMRVMTAAMDTDAIAPRLLFYLGSCVDLLVMTRSVRR